MNELGGFYLKAEIFSAITPVEEARIDLVCYLWEKLDNYIMQELPTLKNVDLRIDLEQKLMSWVMQSRRKHEGKFLCLRLGDTPFTGISGVRHKVDNVIYSWEHDVSTGYIVECKNVDISSFIQNLNEGLVPHVERISITLLLFKAFDICSRLFFKRHFYFDTRRTFCMLVTTKPLDSASLSVALSYGICVIQPQRNAYFHFIKKLDPKIPINFELLEQIPLYFPPEVIWKGLSANKKASKANTALAFTIFKQIFSKNLESILLSLSNCQENFQRSLSENKDIAKKNSYLSMYFNSLALETRERNPLGT